MAEPALGAQDAVQSADAVVFCPSNPWVSIDPILQVIRKLEKPVFAVSPIIGGQAVKGPAAKMFSELGIEPSAYAVADHYRGFLKGFMLDHTDMGLIESVKGLNMQTHVTYTLMKSLEDITQLATEVMDFIREVI